MSGERCRRSTLGRSGDLDRDFSLDGAGATFKLSVDEITLAGVDVFSLSSMSVICLGSWFRTLGSRTFLVLTKILGLDS